MKRLSPFLGMARRCIFSFSSVVVFSLMLNSNDGVKRIPSEDESKIFSQLFLDKENGRTLHGYRKPRPPFQSIIHTSHECSFFSKSRNSSDKVYLATAVPHLIIIGAQKSGTSSLQQIFDQEPNMLKPSFRRSFTYEAHFFDTVLNIGNKRKDFTEDQLCMYQKKYTDFFDIPSIQPNVSVVFEKTPSYILYPAIAQAIIELCPWKPKILATLRNPVNRALSQYQMEHGNRRYNSDLQLFYDEIENEIKEFVSYGFLRGPYIDQSDDNRDGTLSLSQFLRRNTSRPFLFHNYTIEEYAEVFSNYNGNRKGGYLLRGLYAPQLLPWVQLFAAEDRLMVLQFESFVAEERLGNRRTVNQVLEFVGLVLNDTAHGRDHKKSTNHALSRRLVWAMKRNYDPMPSKVREYLTYFFTPFNQLLPELLGIEWRNVWQD